MTDLARRRRKHWGWGYEDEQLSAEQVKQAAAPLAEHLGFALPREIECPVPLERVRLAPPRLAPPRALADICATDTHARATQAMGKSYCDVVRGFRGQYEHPPDFVVHPREEADIERVLEWCAGERVAVVPYGGGTSVVGGVEPRVEMGHYNGAISLNLSALKDVQEIDKVSRAARIQAGATGPGLESQLAEQGLTLRHFPQSFELSTLGGWIATRAAGHFATAWTHIEDFVESARAITPSGAWESRRLPGSGAGPSPDRLLVGSEGTLGVITEAWVRVQPRPLERASADVRFERFMDGVECVRALSQSGLQPSNCRLIDAQEASLTFAGDGRQPLLLLGFESHDHEVAASLERALAICAEQGGVAGEPRVSGSAPSRAGGAVGAWREAFLRAPYVRDVFVAIGVLSETFETAITWERFPALHEQVLAAAHGAADSAAGAARVTCRFTHIYPDGPAPYYTVLAPARRGEEVEQWQAIKDAVSDALIAAGGTITHHHAVGRDHRQWYDRQRPDAFAAALQGAKAAVDPIGIMNPGVLMDAAL